jgi:ABC-type multidrug transport system fused ATPase/permease subunit
MARPSNEAPTVTATAWRTLLRQLQPYRRELAIAASWRILFRLLPVQVPLLAGVLVDGLSGRPTHLWGFDLSGPHPHALVERLGLALTAIAILTGVAAYASARSAGLLHRLVVRNFRLQVLTAWAYASPAFHRRHGASALSDHTLSDTRSIGPRSSKAAPKSSGSSTRPPSWSPSIPGWPYFLSPRCRSNSF